PALARRADIRRPHPLIVGHRHHRRLAVARMPLDRDMLRVHRLVGLEVVDRTARAPGPRAQRAPIIRLARLPFVAQTDDAQRQPGPVVGLNAAGIERSVAPPFGQSLLLPRRTRGTTAAARPESRYRAASRTRRS